MGLPSCERLSKTILQRATSVHSQSKHGEYCCYRLVHTGKSTAAAAVRIFDVVAFTVVFYGMRSVKHRVVV